MKKYVKYLICIAIGLIAFLIVLCVKDVFHAASAQIAMQILSDAAFLPGVFLAGIGLLVFASNGGVFDMLAYGMILLVCTFKRDVRDRKYKDFYEYREAKKARRNGVAYMLIVGLGFIALAGCFLIAYYNV